jgi:hypothetical protein
METLAIIGVAMLLLTIGAMALALCAAAGQADSRARRSPRRAGLHGRTRSVFPPV